MDFEIANDIGDYITIEYAVARDPDAFAIKAFDLPSRKSAKITGRIVYRPAMILSSLNGGQRKTLATAVRRCLTTSREELEPGVAP